MKKMTTCDDLSKKEKKKEIKREREREKRKCWV